MTDDIALQTGGHGENAKQRGNDDLDDLDAFENLSGDGVMTNVISASKVFTLHSRSVEIRKPCILS